MTAEIRSVFELPPAMFWDVDQAKLEIDKHRAFIISRVLQYGRPAEIKWLFREFSPDQIIDVVKSSRNIDIKTAKFWALHFKIPHEEITCLKTPSHQIF